MKGMSRNLTDPIVRLSLSTRWGGKWTPAGGDSPRFAGRAGFFMPGAKRALHSNEVLVLGDGAHTMIPANLAGANTAIRDVGDLSRFRSEKDVSQAVKAHDELVIPCGKDLAFEVEQWGASGAPTAQKPDLYPYNLDLVFWEP
ncbi:hypothetical protein N7470_009644 [Penicillium chermesinum]|nr:hypothetical protein N7470_009644 [Penicillium chermesinum]